MEENKRVAEEQTDKKGDKRKKGMKGGRKK